MRKWLIGIAVAGGFGVAGYALSKLKRISVQNHHVQAIDCAEAFLKFVASSSEKDVRHETELIPGMKSWLDKFSGTVADEEFLFVVKVDAGEDDAETRTFLLRWRDMMVQVSTLPTPANENPHVFERIHMSLKKSSRLDDNSQPS